MTNSDFDPVLLEGLQRALDPILPPTDAAKRIARTLHRTAATDEPVPRARLRVHLAPQLRTLIVASVTAALLAGALFAGFGLRTRSTASGHPATPASGTSVTRDSTTFGPSFIVTYGGALSGTGLQLASCHVFSNDPGSAEIVVSGVGRGRGSVTSHGDIVVYLVYKNPPGLRDSTFALHDSADLRAMRAGEPQATVVFNETASGSLAFLAPSFRSVSGTISVSNDGLDGTAYAHLLERGRGQYPYTATSATAYVTWSCTPAALKQIDPCTLLTTREASATSGVVMGSANRIEGPAQGAMAALAGPLPLCEFTANDVKGSNVIVAVEAFQGGSPVSARAFFEVLRRAWFNVRQLPAFDNGAGIVRGAGIGDAIYVLDGPVFFDVVCLSTQCSDSALKAAAISITRRL